MIIREINGQIYSFKFGLKYLTLLKDFLYNVKDEEILLQKLFFLAIDRKDNWQQVYKTCPDALSIILFSLFNSFDIEGSFDEIKQYILQMDPLQFDQLCKVLVGEVGMSIEDFYNLSPHEANLIYQGYLKRKELEGNIMIMAIREAFNSQAEPLTLVQDIGYKKASLEERNKTFQNLGILRE